MKKEIIFLGIAIVILIGVSVFAAISYNENNFLKVRNNQLEMDRTQISNDKQDVMTQLDQCRNQSQIDHAKYIMLMQDYSNIEKSCPTGNVCTGKFPFMRYACNAQGDAVDNGNQICYCDGSCKLVVQ